MNPVYRIRMPEFSAGHGTALVKWLVGAGDRVIAGQPLAELESDKAALDLEAERTGLVAELCVAEGAADIQGGTVLALLVEDSAAASGESSIRPQSPASATSGGRPADAHDSLAWPPPSPPADAAPANSAGDQAPSAAGAAASALAIALARQSGIALDSVTATGPGGRVQADDVLAATGRARASAEPWPRDDLAVAAAYPGIARGDLEVVEPDRARRSIAARCSQAKREQPHYYMSADLEVDGILDLRALLNEQASDAERVSLNDILIKLAAHALDRAPALNAAWIDGRIHRYAQADIAFAVATPHGLLTPVLRDARRMRLGEIATRIRDLTARGTSGTLRPEELTGGTFTVSNLGMHGVSRFAAILNPPQAAILAMGAAEARAVALDGKPAVATRITCTLSVDHRVADGIDGARFLAELQCLATDPRSLLL